MHNCKDRNYLNIASLERVKNNIETILTLKILVARNPNSGIT